MVNADKDFYSMKNNIPKTNLEIELFCQKMMLEKQVKLLEFQVRILNEVLKEKYLK